MCFGRSQSAPIPQRTFDDSPPVVTGSQTGVEKPKDTKKATERLEQDRRESEGFFNPGDSLKIPGVTRSGSGGNKTAQQKKNIADNKQRAKDSALARKKNKSFSNRAKGV
jgi:hypothetical protein